MALNIHRTTRSNYGTMSSEFGIQFQFSVSTGNQTSLECLNHNLSYTDLNGVIQISVQTIHLEEQLS